MGRLAAKHTAKELNQKAKDALTNKSGGANGKADRAGGVAGHAKYECPQCGQAAPYPKSGINNKYYKILK